MSVCKRYSDVLGLGFFFKQKTAYEVRISDWSSDVCSSDLVGVAEQDRAERCVVVDVLAAVEVHQVRTLRRPEARGVADTAGGGVHPAGDVGDRKSVV